MSLSSLSVLLDKIAIDQDSTDFVTSLVTQTIELVAQSTNADFVRMMLEISAEAARNPRIARILQELELGVQAKFTALFCKKLAIDDPVKIKALQTRIELVATIFSGLTLRAPLFSEINQSELVCLINNVIQFLFKEDQKLN